MVNGPAGWTTAQRRSHHALTHAPQPASMREFLRQTGSCQPATKAGHNLVVSLVIEFSATDFA